MQHWKDGGHDQLCKLIKKAGGAEQYNANNKYTDAVRSRRACADDTKGQTCYICTQALHWKTKEGLVRMCACRRPAGFAHVSCLAEQAKILVAEGEENNLAWEGALRGGPVVLVACASKNTTVRGALGWACWKAWPGGGRRDNARGGNVVSWAVLSQNTTRNVVHERAEVSR